MHASTGWELPVEEVSALCLSAGGASLIGVGDDRWCFGSARITRTGLAPEAPTRVDGRPPEEKNSEFEGVASDATGRLFVLREGPAQLLVVDEAGNVGQTVQLRVTNDIPRLAAEWNDAENENSRGEGVLLLRDGHVLVAKQRESTWLIEFGAPGESAKGFTTLSPLRPSEAFALTSTTTEMHALTAWLVDQPELQSLNDLATDDDGRLYIVSSTSRRLGRLDQDLDPSGGRARPTAYDLPAELFQTKDDKAEGLVHSSRLGWLVGLDLDRDGDNVISITGVP
jgi:hypothetical protein